MAEQEQLIERSDRVTSTGPENLDNLGKQLEDMINLAKDGAYCTIIGGYLDNSDNGPSSICVEFVLPNGEQFKQEWKIPLNWDGSSNIEKILNELNITPTEEGMPEVLNRRVPFQQTTDDFQIDEASLMQGDWYEYDSPLYDQHYGTADENTSSST